MFLGVDGFRKGWVVVALVRSGFVEARAFARFSELMAHYSEARVIGVDMPVGLVEAGDREADQAARDFLSGQASSVFNAPPRPVLAAEGYAEALELSVRSSGKGISKQSFALGPKILEVQEFIDDVRVHEVHPEVSFRLLNGGERLARKKSWGGLQARLRLLRSAGVELPEDLGEVNAVGVDDVVDAAGAAWSARRIGAGEARSFPAVPAQLDRASRAIAVWG